MKAVDSEVHSELVVVKAVEAELESVVVKAVESELE